ncbi:MAG: sulfatase-like hydrolase/transferase [Candidatus Cyclobacteriaceae bacterium M3_2C_046]
MLRDFIQNIWWMGILGLFSSCVSQDNPIGRPNFIILQADDLGWDDLGIHGNSYVETQNLDRLAQNSIRFKNFYVAPVCAPSRASLLTGRHHLLTGVSHVHGGKDFIHLDEQLLGQVLQNNGYATGMWGKWHSGKTEGYLPWQRGFQEAYMAQLYKHEDSRGLFNGELVEHQKWADEVIVDYAIDFIQKQDDTPYLAYLSFLTCHAPLVAPVGYVEKYQQKGLSKNLATLYGMIDHMDGQIGRLIQWLEQENHLDHTIIFFLSDNGPAVINNLLSDQDRRIRYVNQYKGHKGNIWENGVKSPFLVYSSQFEATRLDQLADITDLFPTILDLAGVKIPDNLTGTSLLPVLRDHSRSRQKTVFYYANPGWPPTDRPWTPEGIENEYAPITNLNDSLLDYGRQIIGLRNQNFKLMLNPSPIQAEQPLSYQGYYLVDMLNDPLERLNMYDSRQVDGEQMVMELKNWYNETFFSSHAFAMPEFVIDASLPDGNVVLGYGPQNTSPGMVNTSFYLTNWRSGGWADYKIRVKNEGHFQVSLDMESDQPDSLQITFYLHNKKQEDFIPAPNCCEFAPLYFRPSDTLLRIKMDGPEKLLENVKLQQINLSPLEN